MDPDRLIELVLSSLDADKAENIIQIDLRGKSAVADYMVVASGRSQRHVGALSDLLLRKMKNVGVKQVQVEGLPNCDWVLVDTGDIVVHLFRPEVRDFYNLEKMWQMDVSEDDTDAELPAVE
ncbi:MAG: ribosome silencing factor [Parvibaculales bacterium]